MVDHHKLGTVETIAPVFFRNQPLGCTATIVYQMYNESSVHMDKKIAGLLCSAIISDTLLFRSPTCTLQDKMAAGALALIADISIEEFAKEMFGEETKVKFRPHHFPFTEPSAEMDVSCFKCGGKGCRFCKGSGWIEILGCGMVHPHVLEMCGIDPEEYVGFAFGVGLERIALLKYEIDDMRLLYENDIRFLKQF